MSIGAAEERKGLRLLYGHTGETAEEWRLVLGVALGSVTFKGLKRRAEFYLGKDPEIGMYEFDPGSPYHCIFFVTDKDGVILR